MIKKSISILGCGWLGFPLGNSLVSKGFEVHGSTTSIEKMDKLKEAKITPYLVSFPDETQAMTKLLNTDILVLNIPPGTKRDPSGKVFLETINLLIKHINTSSVKHLIYTSTTSVYLSENKIVKEFYVRNESPLFSAENMLQNKLNKPLTILRLAGLVGPGRSLLRFFSGKQKTGGNLPVNYVYLDDVIAAIEAVIKAPQAGIFNVCADLHPTKEEFYTLHCKKQGLPLPQFIEQDLPWKIINNEAFKEEYNFTYQFKDPLEFPL